MGVIWWLSGQDQAPILFTQRVHKYWNLLPLSVKKTRNINQFKNNLLKFKESNIYVSGNYWEVSGVLMEKIEPEAYRNNKKYSMNMSLTI